MADITEGFIPNSENTITLTITEAGLPVAVSWTQIDVTFNGLTITRTNPGTDGITFVSGVLNIIPGSLTAQEKLDIDAMPTPSLYRVFIRVYSLDEPAGVLYGATDSDSKLYFWLDRLV